MANITVRCKYCAELFTYERPSSGPRRSYCSDRCRWDAAHQAQTEKRRAELRASGRGAVGDEIPCAYVGCQARFVKTAPNHRYCSKACDNLADNRKQANVSPVYYKACPQCGATVAQANKSGTPKPCPPCRRELLRGRNARKNHKRRASGKPVLSVAQIAERDGNTCHLCQTPIDLTLSGKAQAGPTIDHVVPVSKGGTNDGENLALAHRDCNTRRSNREAAPVLA